MIDNAGGIPMVKDGNAKPSRSAVCNTIVQRMRKAISKVDHVEALAH
jgi:hypothetical protein